MEYKKLIPFINAENELEESVLAQSEFYGRNGADGLFLYNYCKDELGREQFLRLAKQIANKIDIPVILGLYVERFEDVKKALYTGASKVVIKKAILDNDNCIKEASRRFGQDKLIIELEDFHDAISLEFNQWRKDMGIWGVLIKHLTLTEALTETIAKLTFPVFIRDSLVRNDLSDLLFISSVCGVVTNHFAETNLLKVKHELKKAGVIVNTYDASLCFSDFKLNSEGLIPVIVQHYQTSEVLMLAYMNKEAYEKTISTGIMTYYSRSRNKLWLKGETSGNYQYVMALTIDCDNDTILAKVDPAGPACHTGANSCFYTDLMKKDYEDLNPLTVLQDVYNIITERRAHPKEGSYTNYLFDKGIDKILKKCGEEATEIVIAAKNTEADELKYEISDFLYHMMVLMVQCGVDWKDIVRELAHRR